MTDDSSSSRDLARVGRSSACPELLDVFQRPVHAIGYLHCARDQRERSNKPIEQRKRDTREKIQQVVTSNSHGAQRVYLTRISSCCHQDNQLGDTSSIATMPASEFAKLPSGPYAAVCWTAEHHILSNSRQLPYGQALLTHV